MLNKHCGKDSYEIILFDKGHNKQETRKKELFQQYEFKHHYSECAVELEWISPYETAILDKVWVRGIKF